MRWPSPSRHSPRSPCSEEIRTTILASCLRPEVRAISPSGSAFRLARRAVGPDEAGFWPVINREDFSDMYARAREERADLLFEELFEIADKPCTNQGAAAAQSPGYAESAF